METHHKSVHVVAALFRRDWLFDRIASLYTLAGVAGPSPRSSGWREAVAGFVRGSSRFLTTGTGRSRKLSVLRITALSFSPFLAGRLRLFQLQGYTVIRRLLQYYHIPDEVHNVLGLCFALCVRSREVEAW